MRGMGMTDEEKSIVLHRLETMPPNMKLSIGDYGAFTRDELIKHVKENDEVGRIVVNIHMNQLRSYKKLLEVIESE
jgi:hypothetical protein